MLELELNEEEEDEIRHLKSIGLTAIESLTAIFEVRMTKVCMYVCMIIHGITTGNSRLIFAIIF